MKKIIMSAICVIVLFICTTAYANEEIMKISMDGEVKQAKEIGAGKGVSFTLPELETNKFVICGIELCMFEKQDGEENYSAFGESRMIDDPTTLNISVDFGDISRFAEKAKYKIAYRYYVKSIDDMSKTVIAGQNIKDGWRLIGEVNPQDSSEGGFSFYKNAAPELDVAGVSFEGETIDGLRTVTYTMQQLSEMYLPKDAMEKGVTLQLETADYDAEDNVSIHYRLIDEIEGTAVSEGLLPDNNRITAETDAEFLTLILTAMDNWGAQSKETTLSLMIDREPPVVLSEFLDMGRALRGRNLYSRFTIIDDQNEALTDGNVYYTVMKSGSTICNNIKIGGNTDGEYTVDRTNLADGVYEIELTVFDKAYNKTTHTLMQTLDNTAPSVTFLTPEEDSEATLYSTWLNESKKIIFTASDVYAGIKKSYLYLNYSFYGNKLLSSASQTYTFRYNVTTAKTGKLYYYFYVYDDAATINKSLNSINNTSNGNSLFVSRYVWLDKTPPDITINVDENRWYEAPTTIYADIYDYPSTSSVADNSGVKTKLYEVTETEVPSGNWQPYSSGVVFENGGVYYLHIKAIDFAGNETVKTKKVKVNTHTQLVSDVTPTDDSRHTIYNEKANLYIIKNTAYSTKYHFTVQDNDVIDTIKTDIVLVSNDNAATFASSTIQTPPNGNQNREVIFNLPYTNEDGSALPDGVYTMKISLTEVKNDGTELLTTDGRNACEVVIKRNAPPVPVISVNGGYVAIDYPLEALAGSLNRSDIKSLYKREYKAVKDGVPSSNVYKSYTSRFEVDDIVVTALYTDPAGNISTASKRIFKEPDTDIPGSIITDGNTVTVEESRAANVYYIGTRRDKQKGLDDGIFDFIQD